MSDSSDESVEEWVLYRDRPEWKDVQPVPQDDGPYPVVAIAYSERYKDVYDYFRGVVVKGEKSERVLSLCRDALILNPANYTVWQYRRIVLKHLNYDLKQELDYIASVIEDHPKNYQVWHHRRVVVEWFGDGSNELDFTSFMLKVDEKNYHAWQHRQWALSTFKLFDNELDYVNDMLTVDVRNNSAWNHRYFILNATDGFTSKIVDQEIDYVINALQRPPINNESAWNYLRGILLQSDMGLTEPKVTKFSTELYEKGCRSVHLLAFLADSSIEMIEKHIGNPKTHMKRATELLTELAEKHDVMRENYWNYLKRTLQQQYPLLNES